MAGKKPGPATLCEPKSVAAVAKHIEEGASLSAACGAEGVNHSTLDGWRKKAANGIEPYATIIKPLKRAIAIAVATAEKRVYRGGQFWQSSARWLESMRPGRWRRTEKREVTQTQDIRFSWPDLAKSGPGMAARRAAAIDEALRKAKEN